MFSLLGLSSSAAHEDAGDADVFSDGGDFFVNLRVVFENCGLLLCDFSDELCDGIFTSRGCLTAGVVRDNERANKRYGAAEGEEHG